MIRLEKYQEQVEKEYWKSVCKFISENDQKRVVKSCRNFMPPDFFRTTGALKIWC